MYPLGRAEEGLSGSVYSVCSVDMCSVDICSIDMCSVDVIARRKGCQGQGQCTQCAA